jgi:hypothetical protein
MYGGMKHSADPLDTEINQKSAKISAAPMLRISNCLGDTSLNALGVFHRSQGANS